MTATFTLEQQVATAFYGAFPSLREVQSATIEPIMSGRNLVLTSGTGSGKTEAVVAPLVSKYWRQFVASSETFILYVAPTKALVNDLQRRLEGPLSKLGLSIGVRHSDQDDLAKKAAPHVLITTPESLEVLLFRQDKALPSIRGIVIDEVHQLYNTQRGLQLAILLRRLHSILSEPDVFQWIAISATVGNLKYVSQFLFGEDEEPVELRFSTARSIDANIRHMSAPQDFLELVRKLSSGREIKLLVFANSRRECEQLASILQEDQTLQPHVLAHYSSLSTEVRRATEKTFASANSAICLATSTLELGIDIGDIDAVILWGVPRGVESFLQRIGRGNRRRNKVNVICVVPFDSTNPVLDGIRFSAHVDAATQGHLPVREPFDLFGAVGQQCLSIISSKGDQFTRVAELCELVGYRPHLPRSIVEAILAELASKGFLQKHGYKNRYGADEELHILVDLRLIYGNLPASAQQTSLFYGAKHIGEVPRSNLIRVRANDVVRFAGKSWRITKITHEGIHLEPTNASSSAIDFTYGGKDSYSDPFISNSVWKLICANQLHLNLFEKRFATVVSAFLAEIRNVSSQSIIPFVRSADGVRYYTFAGNMVNRAVCLFSRLKPQETDDLSLLVPTPIDWSQIPTNPSDFEQIFPEFFEASQAQSMYQMQLPLDLQRHEYLQNWLKAPEIREILQRLSQASPQEISRFSNSK